MFKTSGIIQEPESEADSLAEVPARAKEKLLEEDIKDSMLDKVAKLQEGLKEVKLPY